MEENQWQDLGSVQSLKDPPLREILVGKTKIALSYQNGRFGAVSGVCNHAGGPLGKGRLDADFIICPWHNWKFHRIQGTGEPGSEDDRVPMYELKEENGHLFVNLQAVAKRHKKPSPPHPLARSPKRAEGPIRVAGISTTAMDAANPRYST